MEKSNLKYLTERYLDEGWETERYIENLLPEELAYLNNGDSIKTSGTEILALLVGFSWEPLLISVCAYKPEKVILILNKYYNKQEGGARGDCFKDYIKKLKDKGLIKDMPKIIPNPVKTVNETPEDVFEFLNENILPDLNEGKRVVIDITGAKKSMVSGAYLFSSYTDCPVSYVDYEEYSEKHGKPYGYTCKIRELKNPAELFKLREWNNVEHLYGQYAFKRAKELVREIKDATSQFLQEDEKKAIALLTECLEFYEKWDEGDYRDALIRYSELRKKVPIECLTAVEKLGVIWPDKKNLKGGVESIEGLKDLMNSIYLKDDDIIAYTDDELEKIKRLIEYNEDYRSALLRSAGLSDFLLKARMIRLWVDNKFIAEINGEDHYRKDIKNQDLAMIDSKLLEFSGATNIISTFGWNPSEKGRILNLYGLRNLGEVKAHGCKDGKKINNFWKSIDKPKELHVPDDLFKLRNKAIHFCLSVPIEIANFALKFTEENLKDFKNDWAKGIISDGKYKTMTWDSLCSACGIKFLPKMRRYKHE